MKQQLLVVDGFADDIDAVRQAVIGSEFREETGPDGLKYMGISRHAVPHWFDLLSGAVGRPITPRLSFFRVSYADELPHSWVHSDGIVSEYAAVVYLVSPAECRGGTAFWRHGPLGIEELPTREKLRSQGFDPDWFYGMVNREWRDLTYWEQVGFVGMAFNRLVTYPTARFHSRYPFAGFGHAPADGRLYWACFYD